MLEINTLNELIFTSINVKIDRTEGVVMKFEENNYKKFKQRFVSNTNIGFNDTDKTISLTEKNKTFYIDDSDFISKKNKIPTDKDIVILNHNNKVLIYDVKEKTQSDNKYFIKNLLAYGKFRELLESEKITDLPLTAEQKLVLISDNYGINKIDYNPTINLNLDENVNYFKDVEQFENELKKDDVLVEYLKIEIIKQLKNIEYNNQINTLLNSLIYIIENANKEFRVYLKKFSFEELKIKVIEEKEKYFLSLRELLSKIFTQVIAIPVSVTALLIAIEKLDTILLIKLFVGAYLLVSVFALLIQVYYLFDYIDLNKQFLKEFKIIKADSGLDSKEVEKEKKKVIRRFLFGYALLIILIFITTSLSVVAYFYGQNKICSLLNNSN